MKYSKVLKVVLGSLAGSGALLYYKQQVNVPENTPSAFAASPLDKNDFSPTKWDANWDQRNDEKSHATRNIILIRHGQYILDAIEKKDKKLTNLGKEQAIYTGMRLKSLGLDQKITHFAQSTMVRAEETGELIFKQLGSPDVEVEKSDLLREGAPIQPEPPIDHWNPDPKTFFNDGARIETAFRNFVHRAPPEQEKDSYEVVVCHGNVIRYFVCRALQLPPEAWLRLSLRHASITWLCVRPSGRVSLKCLGDSGHIPTDKLSFE